MRFPEYQVNGNAAAAERLPDRAPEIKRRPAVVPASAGQPGGHLSAQQLDSRPDRGQLLLRGVQEVDVLWQRAAERARHRLGAPVGDKPPADLGFHLRAEGGYPA